MLIDEGPRRLHTELGLRQSRTGRLRRAGAAADGDDAVTTANRDVRSTAAEAAGCGAPIETVRVAAERDVSHLDAAVTGGGIELRPEPCGHFEQHRAVARHQVPVGTRPGRRVHTDASITRAGGESAHGAVDVDAAVDGDRQHG